MKLELRNGIKISVVPLSRKIKVSAILNFINSFIDEKAYIRYNKKFSYKEEKEWFESTLRNMRKGEILYFAAIYNNSIIGAVEARRGIGMERNNICLGIVISKDFRGKHLGEQMLKFIIKEVQRRWEHKNIFLSVASKNKPAYNLYKKLGFQEFAKFPKWMKYKNKYIDQIFLILRN